MGPLWDFDLAFGNTDYADTRYYEGWWVRYNPWYERLFEDPVFTEMVKALTISVNTGSSKRRSYHGLYLTHQPS